MVAVDREQILRIASQHRTLEEVLRWSLGLAPPRLVGDVIVQDEYTHDVVLPWSDDTYLVYDTT